MNTDVVIKVHRLTKRYQLAAVHQGHRTLREAIPRVLKSRLHRILGKGNSSNENKVIWALKDVSFQVKRGELVGLLGPNGAGKSTLLKILSRIIYPTSGYAEIRGRMGSLLEVGTGFHPDLTGRENIYLNGVLIGMTKPEVDGKFHQIVKFSGIEKFIDTPVKFYSSGMYLRLAVAVAAHLDAEILLLDEVLAVGDHVYQQKCLERMSEISKAGRTILFVSHDLETMRTFCRRGIYLAAGCLAYDGEISNAIGCYLEATKKNSRSDDI